MRVIVDGTQAGNRSGTGEYTLQLATWLPRVAQDLDVVFTWPEGVEAPDGTPVIPVRRPRTRALNYLANRGGRLRDGDLIHYPASIGHSGNLGRAVVTVHDVSCFVNPSWFRLPHALYYRVMVSRSARKAAAVIADSEATGRDLRKRLGVESGRIHVIPLGVDAMFREAASEDVAKVRAHYGLPERFLLFVGTHEPRKNLPRLVAAFGRVAREIPHALVLAGRSGWKVEALQQALSNSRVRERILTPGFVAREDLPAVLTAAEGFVWPSLYEGFGLPPLEAMACGTPVLTSDVSSLPEVVGSAALLVDPDDTEAIANAMAELVKDQSLRDGLRRKGLERIKEFTWERTARMTAEVYRSTLLRMVGS
jgi:glycosyltransferase involved in cell wall biosynthesis